jgi:hypothetical protein
MKALLQAACSGPIAGAALRVALVVGTVLNLINQAPAIFSGGGASWMHVALNYVVPYCVASYSGASVQVRQGRSR